MIYIKCTTCHDNMVSEDNYTQFKCPACQEDIIIRCEKCRRKSNIYKCSKCDFEGP